jgi:hypothetical protein
MDPDPDPGGPKTCGSATLAAGVAWDQRQPAARGVADRGPAGRLSPHGGHERLPAGGSRPDGRYYLQGDDIGKL